MERTLEGPPETAAGAAKRPFGVYVMAALQVLNALSHGFGVFAGLEDKLLYKLPRFESDLIASLAMLAGLVVAVGLLTLSRWAWVGTMLWVGGIMAVEIVIYLRGDDPNYAVMAISVLQVFYLNQSEVQAAFNRDRPPGGGRDG